jgi:hypothetical protein
MIEVGEYSNTRRCFLCFHFSEFTNALIEGDPADEFGSEWVKAWMQTDNFRIFNKYTGLFPF